MRWGWRGCNDSFHRGIKPDRPVVTYTSEIAGPSWSSLTLPTPQIRRYQLSNMCANLEHAVD